MTDIRLAGVHELGVRIDRRFSSPAAMFQAALGTVTDRERLWRRGEGPTGLHLLLSEPAFHANRAETRFRRVLDHQEQCRFGVLVVCSWLRPLDKDW